MCKKLANMVERFDEMYDRYIQLLQEDRLQEAAEIGLELAEFNSKHDRQEK